MEPFYWLARLRLAEVNKKPIVIYNSMFACCDIPEGESKLTLHSLRVPEHDQADPVNVNL